MAIKVRALERVFHNGTLYRAGAVFILQPGYKPGRGMEVIAEVSEEKVKVPKAKKEPAKEPETLSELTKASASKTPDGLI